MTRDRCGPLCTNLRSLALKVWDLWCFEDFEENDDSLDQWATEVVVKHYYNIIIYVVGFDSAKKKYFWKSSLGDLVNEIKQIQI